MMTAEDGLITLAAASVALGDLAVPKASYWQTLPPTAHDAMLDFAAQCEGWEAAARSVHGGPALRLQWNEVRSVSKRASASMAHMALTLHEDHSFNDACATDGSYVPGEGGAAGRAAWAVCACVCVSLRWSAQGVTETSKQRGAFRQQQAPRRISQTPLEK